MRILVTGATGFLGQNLCKKLLMLPNVQVIALGRNALKGKPLKSMGAEFHTCSLEEVQLLESYSKNCDYVVHCAAYSSPWGRYQDHYKCNVEGTDHVIQACIKNNVPLIHISTPSVYFRFCDQLSLDENSPLPKKKINNYATTKFLAEQKIMQSIEEKKLKAIILRPRALYGPGDEAIFPRILRSCRSGYLPFFCKKDVVMDLTYIDNASDAIINCIHADSHAWNEIYNITNGEPTPIKNLLTDLLGEVGHKAKPLHIPYPLGYAGAASIENAYRMMRKKSEPPITKYAVGLFAFSQTLNIDKAKKQLNYKPKINTKEGLKIYAKSILS